MRKVRFLRSLTFLSLILGHPRLRGVPVSLLNIIVQELIFDGDLSPRARSTLRAPFRMVVPPVPSSTWITAPNGLRRLQLVAMLRVYPECPLTPGTVKPPTRILARRGLPGRPKVRSGRVRKHTRARPPPAEGSRSGQTTEAPDGRPGTGKPAL